MPAYARPDDSLTVIFERHGEPTIRLAVPEGKALLRGIVLLIAHGDLRAGDRLSIISGDVTEGDDLPAVNRGSHFSG